MSNLNRFSKVLHCWKAYEICYKTHDTTHLTWGMLLQYLGKLKIQIFCRCGRNTKRLHFLIASNFVIHLLTVKEKTEGRRLLSAAVAVFTGRTCVPRVASLSVHVAVAPVEASRTKTSLETMAALRSGCTWLDCDRCNCVLLTIQVDA